MKDMFEIYKDKPCECLDTMLCHITTVVDA